MTTAEVVTALRADAEDRFAPPGVGGHGPYTDLLVHRLDIAVPLDIEVDRPVEPWRASLDFLVSNKGRRGFVKRGLPQLTLRAIDLDWSHGSGPEVSGPAAALGLDPVRPVGLAGPAERAWAGISGHVGRLNPVQWKHNSRGADRFRLGTLVPGEAGRGASDIS